MKIMKWQSKEIFSMIRLFLFLIIIGSIARILPQTESWIWVLLIVLVLTELVYLFRPEQPKPKPDPYHGEHGDDDVQISV